MKKILFIIWLLFCAVISFAQFPNNHKYSTPTTIENPQGAEHPQLAFFPPFLDTLNNSAVSVNGAYTQSPIDSRPYFSDGNKWIPFQFGASPIPLVALPPLFYNSTTGVLYADTTTYLATQYFVNTAIGNILPHWDLAGNTVTSGISFLGSINNASLRFRTNNVERANLDSLGDFSLNGFTNATAYSQALSLTSITDPTHPLFNINLTSAYSELSLKANNSSVLTGLRLKSSTSVDSLVGSTSDKMIADFADVFKVHNRTGGNLAFMVEQGTATSLLTVFGSGRGSGVMIGDSTYCATCAFSVTSAANKGVVFTVMNTAAMNVLTSTAPIGLMIFNTDSSAYCSFTGSIWIKMGGSIGTGGGGGSGTVTSIVKGYGIDTTGGTITVTGTMKVDTTATPNGLSNKYVRIIDVVPAWSLTGNSGTDTSINWIGTNDGHNLRFKVNGQPSGLIDYAGNNNTSFGYQSLLNNTNGTANTAIGNAALRANTTGSQNIAIGSSALIANTTGTANVALGYHALTGNTTGINNMAIGLSLAANTTGSSNTAVGNQNLQANTTGSQNTSIGYNALFNNKTGSNNIAIGYGAMLPYNISNAGNIGGTIWIKSRNGTDSTAGTTDLLAIGNTSPVSMFNVGTSNQFQASSIGDLVKIKGVTYVWPNSEGITNGALVNDGSGNLTWILIDTLNLASGYHTENYFNTKYDLLGSAWSLSGNDPNAATSFLGTTTNKSLRFKTFGTEKMVLDSNGNLLLDGFTENGIYPHAFSLYSPGNSANPFFNYSTNADGGGQYGLLTFGPDNIGFGKFNLKVSYQDTLSHPGYGGLNITYTDLVKIENSTGSGVNTIFQVLQGTQGMTLKGSSRGGGFYWGDSTYIPSATFVINSTTQGVLFPRMSTGQMNAISSPATGLMLYNNDSASIVFYNGAKWAKLGGGSGSGGGGGSVISVATGYGLSGGTITASGTLILDSATLFVTAMRKKDSTIFTTLYQNSLKQAALNGTGFVKITGTSISYDNSTYLTASTVSGKLDSVTRVGTTNVIQNWNNAGTASKSFIDQGLIDSVINISTTVQRVYYTNGQTVDNTFALDSIHLTGDITGGGLLTIATTLRFAEVDSSEHTIPTSITFTATTPPFGTAINTYQWTQVGKMVTIWFHINYTNGGTAVSALNFILPPLIPVPVRPTGFTTNGDYLYLDDGYMSSTKAPNADRGRSYINYDGTNYNVKIKNQVASDSIKYAWARITYPTL